MQKRTVRPKYTNQRLAAVILSSIFSISAVEASASCVTSVARTGDYLKFAGTGNMLPRADGTMFVESSSEGPVFHFMGTIIVPINGQNRMGFAAYASADGVNNFRFEGGAPGFGSLTLPNDINDPMERYGLETASMIKMGNGVYGVMAMGYSQPKKPLEILSHARFYTGYGPKKVWSNVTPSTYVIPEDLPWMQPVMKPGATAFTGGVEEPSLVYDAAHKMLVTWFGVRGMDAQHYYTRRIGVAASHDGINWSVYPNPVMEPKDVGYMSNGKRVAEINMINVAMIGNKYIAAINTVDPQQLLACQQAFLQGASGQCASDIALMYSADGIHWTPHNANPVIEPLSISVLGNPELFVRGPFFATYPDGRLYIEKGPNGEDTARLYFWTDESATYMARVTLDMAACNAIQ